MNHTKAAFSASAMPAPRPTQPITPHSPLAQPTGPVNGGYTTRTRATSFMPCGHASLLHARDSKRQHHPPCGGTIDLPARPQLFRVTEAQLLGGSSCRCARSISPAHGKQRSDLFSHQRRGGSAQNSRCRDHRTVMGAPCAGLCPLKACHRLVPVFCQHQVRQIARVGPSLLGAHVVSPSKGFWLEP